MKKLNCATRHFRSFRFSFPRLAPSAGEVHNVKCRSLHKSFGGVTQPGVCTHPPFRPLALVFLFSHGPHFCPKGRPCRRWPSPRWAPTAQRGGPRRVARAAPDAAGGATQPSCLPERRGDERAGAAAGGARAGHRRGGGAAGGGPRRFRAWPRCLSPASGCIPIFF